MTSVQNDLTETRAAHKLRESELTTSYQSLQLESKRHQLAKTELREALDASQREAKAATSKMELLQREIFKIQNSAEKEKLHLEAENREISAKLKTFENLEKELDSVVLHIADDDNENDPEQMLRWVLNLIGQSWSCSLSDLENINPMYHTCMDRAFKDLATLHWNS